MPAFRTLATVRHHGMALTDYEFTRAARPRPAIG